MSKHSVAVIGGGPAGFFAAISKKTHFPDAEVSLFEGSNKLLSKVLISGGGRCNVCNHTTDVIELCKNYPRGFKELRGAFYEFATLDTIKWFNEAGVKLKTEADLRMFPVTDDSSSIANALMDQAKLLGVKVFKKHQLVKILKTKDAEYSLEFKDQQDSPLFNQVILTTGSKRSSYQLAEDLGHTIKPLIPSLFSFEVRDQRIADLPGVAFQDVSLELILPQKKKFKFQGPVLITHWGFSGPAIIKLSALAAIELFNSDYQAELKINFTPELNQDRAFNYLTDFRNEQTNKKLFKSQPFDMPKRYWLKLLELCELDEENIWQEVSKKQLILLSEQLSAARFEVAGKGQFKDEFVTAGGVSLREVNFKTMESKISPGLFFAGEVLDIDGITGGFNFQSAWTTGWIAGKS